MADFYKQLVLARENRGLTQKEFAMKLGYDVEWIVNLEQGKIDPPLSLIVKAAKELNWSFKIGDVSI